VIPRENADALCGLRRTGDNDACYAKVREAHFGCIVSPVAGDSVALQSLCHEQINQA
jgi:hypothetical protein